MYKKLNRESDIIGALVKTKPPVRGARAFFSVVIPDHNTQEQRLSSKNGGLFAVTQAEATLIPKNLVIPLTHFSNLRPLHQRADPGVEFRQIVGYVSAHRREIVVNAGKPSLVTLTADFPAQSGVLGKAFSGEQRQEDSRLRQRKSW